MLRVIASLGCGLLFAIGLLISGIPIRGRSSASSICSAHGIRRSHSSWPAQLR